jgi:hypothetical protein
MHKKVKKYWNPNFCGPDHWSTLVTILGKKKTPKTPHLNKKRFRYLCWGYLNFTISSCRHVRLLLVFPYKCWHFRYFYLILPNFLPIGIFMKFLVWSFSLKIFLTTLLYGWLCLGSNFQPSYFAASLSRF